MLNQIKEKSCGFREIDLNEKNVIIARFKDLVWWMKGMLGLIYIYLKNIQLMINQLIKSLNVNKLAGQAAHLSSQLIY